MLDLAHASEALFDECLERYEGRSASRTPAAAPVNDHPRNLTDSQLRALAERDGVLGIMLHPLTVDPERRTIERAIDHIEHAAATMGAERVCLGGDWTKRLQRAAASAPPPDGLLPPGLDVGASLEGLAGPEDYPALVEALRRPRLGGRAARRAALRQPAGLSSRGAARLARLAVEVLIDAILPLSGYSMISGVGSAAAMT